MDFALPDQGGALYHIPRQDGLLIDVFDKYGRHIEVRHVLTDAVILTIQYGGNSTEDTYPVSITGADGNVIVLERNNRGQLTAIIGANGERSELAYNVNMLSVVTTPGGINHSMQYDPREEMRGLLTAYIDPKGNTDRFEYDDGGRLTRNLNPAGGGWRLSTESDEDKETTTHIMTSAMGRSTRYTKPDKGG